MKHTNEELLRKRQANANQSQPMLRDFDMQEITACIDLLLVTGVMKSKHESLEQMWSEVHGRPLLRATMPVKRFKTFLSCARFDDKTMRPARQSNDRLAAVRVMFDRFAAKCLQFYSPSPFMCVDETLAGFKGKCRFRVYIPSKPDRYGIEVWTLCDNKTHYLYNFQVYLGKEGLTPQQNQGARVVQDLTVPIYNSGRNITTDNFFTSHALGQFLLSKSLTLLGTVRKSRKEVPMQLMMKRRPAYESKFAFTSDTMLVSYAPKKNKTVLVMSTMHEQPDVDLLSESKKPYAILDYATKGAVDSFD